MSELRKRFVEDLSLRNYARRTIETYTRHVACFARHFGRSPEELGPEEIRSYQLYLIQEKGVSWSTFNQAVCALRFLYRITLPRAWAVTMIAFAKKPKKLPCVLGAEEVIATSLTRRGTLPGKSRSSTVLLRRTVGVSPPVLLTLASRPPGKPVG